MTPWLAFWGDRLSCARSHQRNTSHDTSPCHFLQHRQTGAWELKEGYKKLIKGVFQFFNMLYFKEFQGYLTNSIFTPCIFGTHHYQYIYLPFGSISKGLETTEFTNLIGWNWYWKQSIFSHLEQCIDQQCFTVKKLQTRVQKNWVQYLFIKKSDPLLGY